MNCLRLPARRSGDVSARLILRGGGNAEVDVEGQVIADNPASTRTIDARAVPPSHGAVWKLNITVAGTPLTVPIYVDAITAGPEAAFASAKIQLCLAGPIGTPTGAQLLFAFFDVNGVFTNPSNTSNRALEDPVHAVQRQFADPDPESRWDDRGPGTRAGAGRPDDEGQEPDAGPRDHHGPAARERPAVPRRGHRALRRHEEGCPDEDECAGQLHRSRGRSGRRRGSCAQILELADLALPCPAPPPPAAPQGCKTATLSFFAANVVTARRKR